MIYRSHSGLLIFLFIVLFLGLFYLVAVGAVTLAFAKIGIRPQYLLTLFFLILIGSAVNIPIKQLENEELSPDRVISFYGFRYRLPPHPTPDQNDSGGKSGGSSDTNAYLPICSDQLPSTYTGYHSDRHYQCCGL